MINGFEDFGNVVYAWDGDDVMGRDSWDASPRPQVYDACQEAETNRTKCRAERAKFLDLFSLDVLDVLPF